MSQIYIKVIKTKSTTHWPQMNSNITQKRSEINNLKKKTTADIYNNRYREQNIKKSSKMW